LVNWSIGQLVNWLIGRLGVGVGTLCPAGEGVFL